MIQKRLNNLGNTSDRRPHLSGGTAECPQMRQELQEVVPYTGQRILQQRSLQLSCT